MVAHHYFRSRVHRVVIGVTACSAALASVHIASAQANMPSSIRTAAGTQTYAEQRAVVAELLPSSYGSGFTTDRANATIVKAAVEAYKDVRDVLPGGVQSMREASRNGYKTWNVTLTAFGGYRIAGYVDIESGVIIDWRVLDTPDGVTINPKGGLATSGKAATAIGEPVEAPLPGVLADSGSSIARSTVLADVPGTVESMKLRSRNGFDTWMVVVSTSSGYRVAGYVDIESGVIIEWRVLEVPADVQFDLVKDQIPGTIKAVVASPGGVVDPSLAPATPSASPSATSPTVETPTPVTPETQAAPVIPQPAVLPPAVAAVISRAPRLPDLVTANPHVTPGDPVQAAAPVNQLPGGNGRPPRPGRPGGEPPLGQNSSTAPSVPVIPTAGPTAIPTAGPTAIPTASPIPIPTPLPSIPPVTAAAPPAVTAPETNGHPQNNGQSAPGGQQGGDRPGNGGGGGQPGGGGGQPGGGGGQPGGGGGQRPPR